MASACRALSCSRTLAAPSIRHTGSAIKWSRCALRRAARRDSRSEVWSGLGERCRCCRVIRSDIRPSTFWSRPERSPPTGQILRGTSSRGTFLSRRVRASRCWLVCSPIRDVVTMRTLVTGAPTLRAKLVEATLERVEALPGVVSAGTIQSLPLTDLEFCAFLRCFSGKREKDQVSIGSCRWQWTQQAPTRIPSTVRSYFPISNLERWIGPAQVTSGASRDARLTRLLAERERPCQPRRWPPGRLARVESAREVEP